MQKPKEKSNKNKEMAPKKSTIVLNVEQFIHDIEERPAIWNRNFHCNKAFLEQMWDELSSAHKLPKIVLKAKWKGLRDNFRVEYKRIPRGDNGDFLVDPATFESKWLHYYALLFLTDHMRHRLPKNEQDQSFYFAQQGEDCEKTVVEPDLTNGLIRRMQDSDDEFDEDDDDDEEMPTPPMAHQSISTASASLKADDAQALFKAGLLRAHQAVLMELEKEAQDLSKKSTQLITNSNNGNDSDNGNDNANSMAASRQNECRTPNPMLSPSPSLNAANTSSLTAAAVAAAAAAAACSSSTSSSASSLASAVFAPTMSTASTPSNSLHAFGIGTNYTPTSNVSIALPLTTSALQISQSQTQSTQLQSQVTLQPQPPPPQQQKKRSVSPPPLYNKAHHPPPNVNGNATQMMGKERDDFAMNGGNSCLHGSHEHLNFTKHSYSNGLIPALKLKRSRLSEDSNFNGSSTMDAPLVPEDDDYHYLLSLHPYMKQLTAAQKLRIRTKIQKLIFKELYKEDLEEIK